MNGTMILMAGAGLIGISIILFIIGMIYGKTAGKRIHEELKREYE